MLEVLVCVVLSGDHYMGTVCMSVDLCGRKNAAVKPCTQSLLQHALFPHESLSSTLLLRLSSPLNAPAHRVHGTEVRLMLWDTAGQEEYDAITKAYYRGAQACVLVFSTTDRESFLAIEGWKQKVSHVIVQ